MTDVHDGAGDGSGADPSHQWSEHLGPFYDATAVCALLGREGEHATLTTVQQCLGLMAMTTESGQVVYPAFQFPGRLLAPALDRVLNELPESLVSRFTLASWLISPERDLEGARPIDVLFDQGPAGVDAVVRAARTWAARLDD